jgi:hypothetical protein
LDRGGHGDDRDRSDDGESEDADRCRIAILESIDQS